MEIVRSGLMLVVSCIKAYFAKKDHNTKYCFYGIVYGLEESVLHGQRVLAQKILNNMEFIKSYTN